MWNLLMGNTESSEEDDVSTDNDVQEVTEEVKVFQPQKLRQELENGTRHF